MSPPDGLEIDAWLRGGGIVVTSSDRATRALLHRFHIRRRDEGQHAWPAPRVITWPTFIQEAWLAFSSHDRMVLNAAQEEFLWESIIAGEKRLATVLEGPRHRLARLVMEAHGLVCGYAPRYLHAKARTGWSFDPGTFSDWLTLFDAECEASQLLSASRVALELIPLLEASRSARAPVLAVGFDKLQPVQQALLDAWGTWRHTDPSPLATSVHYGSTTDPRQELESCAAWCMQLLAKRPSARILVLTQAAAERRGEIERAFLRNTPAGSVPMFEFSLGVSLHDVPLIRRFLLSLRWLLEAVEESALDWLFSAHFAGSNAEQSAALQAHMRAIRHDGHEQPAWTLEAFLRERNGSTTLPKSWMERMTGARDHLLASIRRDRMQLDWAALVPELLEKIFPGETRTLSSADFQVMQRWEQVLNTSASLGFNGQRTSWQHYLERLEILTQETLFAPESTDAPIQIMGVAEAAGLTADAIWFLGADEDAWPPRGAAHPLLPLQVQREAEMPHASPQLDLKMAHLMTQRLMTSAPLVRFSYARDNGSVEARPSRVLMQFAGSPEPLHEVTDSDVPPRTIVVQDLAVLPCPDHAASGGAGLLTAQSQCPFQAFATSRLGAEPWRPAEPCLTAAQRGQILHALLRAVWSGPPEGLHSLDDLLSLSNPKEFVSGHVRRILASKLSSSMRERMSAQYLKLEDERLTQLVMEWLAFEATRHPFQVELAESPAVVTIAGLVLKLRLDRIDRLQDGSVLVIDYKTGDNKIKDWRLPRPADVQLPLYAGFAIPAEEVLGGLVYAKVRSGQAAFEGHLVDAKGQLLESLHSNHSLVKNGLTPEQIHQWRDAIEQLALDYLQGKSTVDPRDYPKTCDSCRLQAVCRIQEHTGLPAAEIVDPEESDD
jgi:ATP-dependent helicase/nuclease subunit B